MKIKFGAPAFPKTFTLLSNHAPNYLPMMHSTTMHNNLNKFSNISEFPFCFQIIGAVVSWYVPNF